MNFKYRATKYTDEEIDYILESARETELTWKELAVEFNEKFNTTKTGNAIRKVYATYQDYEVDMDRVKEEERSSEPKVLIFDIETAPILAYVWGLFDQNIGLNMVQSDWYVLSWSAKWLGDSEEDVMYMDQRDAEDIEDDFEVLSGIWKLLDEADVVITQNGVKFDVKKLNARFILNGFEPPSSYRHIDTLRIAKKYFGFTSNKLAYMTDKLCTKYKKLSHAKFSGFELWKQCLAGNAEAWEEMEEYNRYDVLSLEELWTKLSPWDSTFNFDVYRNDIGIKCECGSTSFEENGYKYTKLSKKIRYRCTECGKEHIGKDNVLHVDKKASIRR